MVRAGVRVHHLDAPITRESRRHGPSRRRHSAPRAGSAARPSGSTSGVPRSRRTGPAAKGVASHKRQLDTSFRLPSKVNEGPGRRRLSLAAARRCPRAPLPPCKPCRRKPSHGSGRGSSARRSSEPGHVGWIVATAACRCGVGHSGADRGVPVGTASRLPLEASASPAHASGQDGIGGWLVSSAPSGVAPVAQARG